MPKVINSKKTCFVIGPIGKENSDIRKNADRLFRYIISPTVEKCGYNTPIRADHIPNPGTITSQVIEQLIDSNLVIADLTSGNPNVFYELAVRHVTKKHCIHVMKSDESIPFDISPNRTVQYSLDLEGVENAKNALEDQILSLIDGKDEVDNPIGIALTMKDLKSSGNSMQIMMADLTEEVRDLKGQMRSFQIFCKDRMNDRTFHIRYDDDPQYENRTLNEFRRKKSVLFREPRKGNPTDISEGRSELKYWERKLLNDPITKEDYEGIIHEIDVIKHWLAMAGDPKYNE